VVHYAHNPVDVVIVLADDAGQNIRCKEPEKHFQIDKRYNFSIRKCSNKTFERTKNCKLSILSTQRQMTNDEDIDIRPTSIVFFFWGGGKRREGTTLLSPFAETSKEYVLIDLICASNLIKICKYFKKILPTSFILNKNDKNKIQNIQTIFSPALTS